MLKVIFVSVLLVAASRASASPARPAVPTAAEADSVTRAIEADRADTREWLRSKPNSYLATVARRDFEEKTSLVVGSSKDADLVIDSPEVRAHHLRVTVRGDSFLVEAVDPEATFRAEEQDRRSYVSGPGSIGVGRYTIRLSHQGYPALIVFDPVSPHFKDYKGLEYFPADLSYRYVLSLTPDPAQDTTLILSTRGNTRRAVRVGWFEFQVGDSACRLEAVRLLEPGVGENSVSVFFTDATTGQETYEVGRYVDPRKLPDGRYVLDFNQAYNPACAISNHYNCPIPSAENRLKVAIRAGEKDAKYEHK